MVKSGRKRIDPSNKKVMSGYSMSQVLIHDLVKISETKGISTSRLVESILQEYVNNYKGEQEEK